MIVFNTAGVLLSEHLAIYLCYSKMDLVQNGESTNTKCDSYKTVLL